MINVSDKFKERMKRRMKEIDASISYDSGMIRSRDDLISFRISCESGMCKASMRKLEVKYKGKLNLLDKWIKPSFGVRLENGDFDYINYGSFLVTKITHTKNTGVTNIVAYDKMINSMKTYQKLEIEYPISLYNYTLKLCEACDLELYNTTLNLSTLEIDKELWENISGITYRDIFVQIAQITCTTCIISEDKIYFKPITDTKEKLTYGNMKKLKLEPIYGEINSVVLGRDPIVGEDVFLKDDESININGLTEFRISNNEIIDKKRETVINDIYNEFKGISFYPFETTTEAFGWYEIGDKFIIENNLGEQFNCVLFNYNITVDGAIKEVLKTTAETKTQSQYQYATKISKRIANTEIIVDKQNQQIIATIDKVNDVEELGTQLLQTVNNFMLSVKKTGTNNLLKNSVMFAYNDGVPSDWKVSENGELSISSNTESITAGCVSGHSFTLKEKTVKQRVHVKADSEHEVDKVYYSFSTKIKKDVTGNCYIKIYNTNEEYKIELPIGQSSFYGSYEIKALLPTDNYYDIEFYGSEDSNATFTDNMFSIGEYAITWSQASGEIMNTQVNINLDGVLVKSSIYQGDYTVMSPLEFAGYSNINGIITKVFSLNKDTTQVKKLKAEDEITMDPIKIVPITEGEIQGWAFVPSAGGGNK